MSFWENLGQKATETTGKAVQKAKELSELAKLNSMVSEEEKKINSSYGQIGRIYVSMHRADYEAEFAGLIASISEGEQKIEEWRRQIQDIKGVKRCANCGAEVPADAAFCSACGAPQTAPQAPVESTADTVCPSCGAKQAADAMFCTECGAKLS